MEEAAAPPPAPPASAGHHYVLPLHIINSACAFVGFLCALLIICRLQDWLCLKRRHPPPPLRKGTLASLLQFLILRLFICNAVYAGVFLLVSIAEVIYLRARQLTHVAGESPGDEWIGAPANANLQEWYNQALFWLQELALAPTFLHIALAWVFWEYVVHQRSPSVLEKMVRQRLWVVWGGVLALTTGVSAICFYTPRRSTLQRAQALLTLVTTVVCLVMVGGLYLQTLIVWRRGPTSSSVSGRMRAVPSLGAIKGQRSGSSSSATTQPASLPPPPVPVGSARQHVRRPLWRLVALLGCFLAVWTWALINDVRALRAVFSSSSSGAQHVRTTGYVLSKTIYRPQNPIHPPIFPYRDMSI